jgi:hypothetical protein
MSWEYGLNQIHDELKRKYPKKDLEIVCLLAKFESQLRAKEAKWQSSFHKENIEAKTE